MRIGKVGKGFGIQGNEGWELRSARGVWCDVSGVSGVDKAGMLISLDSNIPGC